MNFALNYGHTVIVGEESGNTAEHGHKCDMCSESNYATAALLLAHHKKEHGGAPYPCNECPHRAKTKSNLKQHVRFKHAGERPFACEHCDNRFAQSIHKRTHVRAVHYGHRDFACRWCGKTYPYHNGRNHHERQCPAQNQ